MRNILLLVLSLAFVVVGVFLLVVGDPEDRLGAIGCITFFGACLIVFAMEMLPARKLTRDAEGVIEILADRAKVAGLLLGSVLMGVGSGLIGWIGWGEGNWVIAGVGAVGFGFFGIACVLGAIRSARRRVLFRLAPEGISVPAASPPWTLAWNDITAIEPYSVHGQMFAGLSVTPQAEARLSHVGRMNAATGFPRFSVGVQGARVDFADFLTWLERYRTGA